MPDRDSCRATSQFSSASPYDFLGGRAQELVELGIGLFGSLTALGGDGGEIVHGVAGAEIERIEILVPPCSVRQGESDQAMPALWDG